MRLSGALPTALRALALALPGLAANAAEEGAGAGMSEATRWGGVAEARAIWLKPGDGPTVRVQQQVLRLTLEHAFGEGPQLTAHAELQHLRGSDGQVLAQLREGAPVGDRALRLTRRRERPRESFTLGFDWLYLHGKWSHGNYAVGRQPISPSLGRLWAPVDLFAPFSPTDLERLYKPGVDAAQLSWFVGDLGLTTIASADRSPSGTVRLNWQQRAELSAPWGKSFALVGERGPQRFAGLGAQVNDVAGSDVYAEMLVHRGPQALPGVEGSRGGVRAVLGASRKVGTDTVGTLELFRQSHGTADPARYDLFAQRAATTGLPFMGVGRSYLGASLSSRPHPLVGADLLLLGNLSDRSATAIAALEYTPLANLKLRATLGLPLAGASDTEYRRQGRTLQLGMQWFF